MRNRRTGRLGGPATVLLAVLVALTFDACGTSETATIESRPASLPKPAVVVSPGGVDLPSPNVHATPYSPDPLPQPVPIPADPYAPEPVVVYGSIEIPRIGLDTTLYDGVTLNNIDEGPSHWPGSALPGQPGNAVIAGHRVTHTHPFLHIDELQPGDQVIFHVQGVRSVYTVTGHLVVTPDDTWIANQTRAPTATLYACHPPGSSELRYVVQMALATTGPDTAT